MGSKKKAKKHTVKEWASNYSTPARNLPQSDLGAVIFGCKGHTFQEYFSKKIFGLPAPHFSYVKKVCHGLPLFLFNYSDRKLYGIFKAACPGQLNIDPYAWTDGSVDTDYPAQVQFTIYMRCQALTEDKFSPIIAKNYYDTRLFWFELDHSQTKKLIDLFSSQPVLHDALHPGNVPTVEASTSLPEKNDRAPFEQRTGTWSSLFKDDKASNLLNKDESLKIKSSYPPSPLSEQSNAGWESCREACAEEWATSLPENNSPAPFEQRTWSSLFNDDKTSNLSKKDDSLKIESSHPPSHLTAQYVGWESCREPCAEELQEAYAEEEWAEGDNTQSFLEVPAHSEAYGEEEWAEGDNTRSFLEASAHSVDGDSSVDQLFFPPSINKSGGLYESFAEEWAEGGDNTQPVVEAPVHSVSEDSSMDQLLIPPESSDILSQLMQEVAMLKETQIKQEEKIWTLKKELAQSREEFQKLQNQHNVEAVSLPSSQQFEGVVYEPQNCIRKMDGNVLVVGGFDGSIWLPAISLYSPLHDRMESLSPTPFERTYCAVTNLNSEVYVFGGMHRDVCYDTVEAYNPSTNHWRQQPSLNQKKGSLAGASLHGKLFAIGGGDAVECFSEVEMLDLSMGRWMHSRPMLEKRFAAAAAEIKGALYVVGGYDGQNYLKSAERFDPREHTWRRLGDMKMSRGCHSLVAYNEKLYALGGFDGSKMVPSVEILDPRVGSWIVGEEMNNSRGNFGAVVINGMIHTLGGAGNGEEVLDTIECYEDGYGWQQTNLRGFRKRCLFSAIML